MTHWPVRVGRWQRQAAWRAARVAASLVELAPRILR